MPNVVIDAEALRRPGIAERCEIIAGDFFESVPASGDAYILSRVIHDWEDAAALKILGIEIVSAFVLDKSLPEASFTVASAAFIWIGVWGELFFAKKAKEAGDRIVAEANARAAEANKVAEEERLARVRLEAQLQPRTLSQEEIASIQGLADRFPEINLAREVGNETHRFAQLIAMAFMVSKGSALLGNNRPNAGDNFTAFRPLATAQRLTRISDARSKIESLRWKFA